MSELYGMEKNISVKLFFKKWMQLDDDQLDLLSSEWLFKVRFYDFSSSKLTNKVIQMLLGLSFQMLMRQFLWTNLLLPPPTKLSFLKFPADMPKPTAAWCGAVVILKLWCHNHLGNLIEPIWRSLLFLFVLWPQRVILMNTRAWELIWGKESGAACRYNLPGREGAF